MMIRITKRMFARNTIGHVLEVCDKILAKTPNHTALFQAARSISVEIETNFQEDLEESEIYPARSHRDFYLLFVAIKIFKSNMTL